MEAKKNKVGLVLEGGGMRGAYTAGALAWMIDNDIKVDYGAGISSGAMHLSSYFMKSKQYLYDFSVTYVSSKDNIGLRPFLKEGRYVGYRHLFDELVYGQFHYDTSHLVTKEFEYQFGLYDLDQGDTLFFDADYLDKEGQAMKAACSLPIAGNTVNYQGHHYLDGGIKVMIPIEPALNKGCNRNICIITKPHGYVRKKASWFMRFLMRINYLKYPQIAKDYAVRHIAYNKQRAICKSEEEAGRCFVLIPSKNLPVKRFSGDPEALKELYQLGYDDMENRKEELLTFLNN